MIKSLAAVNRSERVKVKVPRSVQQSIPIKRIYTNGIWEVGKKHSRTWKRTDVNYIAASQETQHSIFTAYCAALNALPTDATAKITIVNHRLNPAEFQRRILLPYRDDRLDHYREEANQIMKDRAAQSNNLVQERFVTLSIPQLKMEESRAYFRRAGANLQKPLPAWTPASSPPGTMTGSVFSMTSSAPARSSILTTTITASCEAAETSVISSAPTPSASEATTLPLGRSLAVSCSCAAMPPL